MMLDVPEVVHVQSRARKRPSLESRPRAKCFRRLSGDYFRRFPPAVCHVLLDRRLVVEQDRRAVFELLIVAKKRLIVAMERLTAERLLIWPEVIIRIEQRVE